jgi:MFS family permease
MMAIFFIGVGLSSVFTSLAETPLQIGFALLLIGCFAAIYHPVGLALVVQGRMNTGVPLALNGIFGNMGVACAALMTGFLIDHGGWRFAFLWPGIVSITTGMVYSGLLYAKRFVKTQEIQNNVTVMTLGSTKTINRGLLSRVFGIIFFSTALGGLIFQSTTFALPKVLDERLADLAMSATLVGWYAFLVFAIAAFGQLVVGYLVDNYSIRSVFALVVALQAIFFAIMPGLTGWNALGVSMSFMLVVFGQIPINDVLISRITRSEWRSRVYAFRYVVTFTVMASSVPIIAWIHDRWGFDTLFTVLSVTALCIAISVFMLPKAVSAKHST